MSGISSAIGGALILGGASIASSLIGANAAQSAAQTQASAQEQAIAAQQQMFATIQQQEQPYMQAGNTAAGKLQQLASGNLSAQQVLAMSPNYEFQQQLGMQGVLNGATAQGPLAGSTQAALESFNQGLASNAFQQYYGDLYNIASLGQNAASNTGSQGVSLTGQTSQALSNIGTAQAAGQVGVANALSSGITGLGSAFAAPLIQQAYMGQLKTLLNPNNPVTTTYGPSTTSTGGYTGDDQ